MNFTYGRSSFIRGTMLWLVAGTTLALAGNALSKTEYPARPIRMIMPFAPGGAGDFVARAVQPRLTELLGQQVIVDNRPGAAGNVGVEIAALARPDGYTLLLGNVGAMAINPSLYIKAAINPIQHFAAISQMVDVPGALVVHPSIEASTISELVALAKARPGTLNFGSPGGGSANRLEMELFMMQTGIKFVHIPYKGGAGPAVVGLLSNEVQTMFVTFSSALGHVRNNRLRMLGVVAPERVTALPHVATMKEQGYHNFASGSWQGLYAPKGTPNAALERLFKAVQDTIQTPVVRERLAQAGVEVVVSGSPALFQQFWLSEYRRFAKIIKDAGIESE